MRKVYLVYLLITTPFIIYSQINKQNNRWFSAFSGINFNSIPAQSFSTNNYHSIFGNSSICDSNGNLLLVSDGIHVFNKNGTLVQNGDLIVNNAIVDTYYLQEAGSQGSIIIPKKNNTYYIFTPTASNNEIYNTWINPIADSNLFRYDELLYCIVDMDANNGNGLVTQKKYHYCKIPETLVLRV